MTEDPTERDLRAAEYVIGTLDATERAAMDLELAVDPAARAAVREWERRLAPLAAVIPEIEPGEGVWPAILRALPNRASPSPAANDNRVAALSRKLGLWRAAAAGAGVLAAGLALFIAVGPRPGGEGETRYVAVVSSGGEAPALIVSIDTVAGTARVRPVGAEAPAGSSLELWYVGADKTPKSLGLIGKDAARVALPAGSDAARRGEGVFAVSVEPPNGSATGLPTGPVVYTGKLIRD
ncbi:anti-sigma factor [Methylobacterium sp. SD274]|uniref:anti-sigma factor n=1 Tax=Methylobacterium sp. SD274 TaxID=2782009 RepID=UPI001A960047|nr:anti-sigma factor [Methylobacterium sp. SD274]MBO1020590.1 anti-sigma factor [Methylobacterium sp. SD274]